MGNQGKRGKVRKRGGEQGRDKNERKGGTERTGNGEEKKRLAVNTEYNTTQYSVVLDYMTAQKGTLSFTVQALCLCIRAEYGGLRHALQWK